MGKEIDLDKIYNHWLSSSDKNFLTMEHLYESKDYDWSLFIGHLVIEKLLKTLFIKKNISLPPFIHNLLRLAELSDLELTDEYLEYFSTITTFNINARYDDYKENFSKICTPEFTLLWINRIKELRQWIKMML
jgi:HEPN domain-containing protein